jgi:hypothetical protein
MGLRTESSCKSKSSAHSETLFYKINMIRIKHKTPRDQEQMFPHSKQSNIINMMKHYKLQTHN